MTGKTEGNILILNGSDTLSLLEGCETQVIDVVRRAYEAHSRNQSMLPHSTFLRFPDDDRNRIIALPAYLGDSFNLAGMKWISSFPGNLQNGMERASAVVILNSTETGRPKAIMEGSVISAKRTAASAALAARKLHDQPVACLGIVGCGLINFEVTRFVLASFPEIKSLLLFDMSKEKAEGFKGRLSQDLSIDIADDAATVFAKCTLTSIATTAGTPHIQELPASTERRVILHVSLRDFAPEIILSSENVVDDVDHVCRAQTSLHLAELQTGNRDFIRCTIGELLLGNAKPGSEKHSTTIFSPFGLGILDLAVSDFVFEQALEKRLGTVIESFFPPAWTERTAAEGNVR